VQEEAVAPAVEVQPAEVCQEAQPVSAEQEAWVPRAVRPRGPVRRRDRLTRVQPVRDTAINGIPNGPANIGGLTNSGNDPSGAGNPAKSPGIPGSVEPANPSTAPRAVPNNASPQQMGGTVNTSPPGTNTTGAASSSGLPNSGSRRVNGTTMPGPSRPTVTKNQNSDAKIEDENRKLDRVVRSICRGC
jgi:hypothetical protein